MWQKGNGPTAIAVPGANDQGTAMSDLTTVEVKAFVPARDFALCKQFYVHLGFMVASATAVFSCRISTARSTLTIS
jgi:hypothetical protein